MRFLVDAQLPPALARWLASQGHQAEHVSDHQMSAASDIAIWRFAAQIGAVIVTKDEDFARLRASEETGPQVVWIRIRNTRRTELLRWFDAALADIETALTRGETLIEIV